jgi:hypothetical protein
MEPNSVAQCPRARHRPATAVSCAPPQPLPQEFPVWREPVGSAVLRDAAESRRRCGRVPAQMWPSPGADVAESRCRCGRVVAQMRGAAKGLCCSSVTFRGAERSPAPSSRRRGCTPTAYNNAHDSACVRAGVVMRAGAFVCECVRVCVCVCVRVCVCACVCV